jgi:ethylbenzene dehydrogenase
MKLKLSIICLATMAALPALAADPAKINWAKIPAVKVPLFYPGQSTYEWLRSEDHKGAVKEVTRGDACTTCHDEEDNEKDLGEKLVKANRLEPVPVRGKNGHVDLKVQAAYDDKNAYFRFQWKTNAPTGGVEYPYYRFDGKEWKAWGAPRLDKPVQEGKQPAIYEDRLSMMIDDGKVPMFAQQGCWLTCHDGERDSRHVATKEEVAANEAMKAYGKTDVRKYLPASRNDPSDWKTGKSVEELEKIRAAGGFVDLVQWRANRSNPVGMADDGWVLKWRDFDAGKNPFASNMDDKTKQPKYMYDAAKFGSKDATANQLGRQANSLVKGVNAVPFDPNAGWKEGDMVPRYYLQPGDTTGSAADNKAEGSWKDGMWTVVLTRPLNLANGDDKAFKDGGVYNVGFAVHDDNITTRGHHVSWVRTVGFGAKTKAEIRAVKLK